MPTAVNDQSQALPLDFATADGSKGFRLQRCEVYNWGTFDGRVWSLRPEGKNALLTGDIGSGKSTLVDAITTLLVPAQRITYNKAAGADARERSLRTYVLGHYRAERGDDGLAARAVALRDHHSYSVILGHFYNESLQQDVTLAQVFWIRDAKGQPDRFYVVADRALGIATDFTDFGSDINELRKRLRKADQVELFDTFPPYGKAFRRRFGIAGDQAMELFNQTVSLKSVGNLTEFVRDHMLEPFAVDERIDQLIGHFDDLDRAHQAVVDAREQVEALTPLIADADQFDASEQRAVMLRSCRDALQPYFAGLRATLLEERIERIGHEIGRLDAKVSGLEQTRASQAERRDDLRQAIAASGGDHIEKLKAEIGRLQQEQDRRRDSARAYRGLIEALDWSEPADEAGFRENQERAQQEAEGIADRRSELQNALTDAEVAFRKLKSQHEELQTELTSLRQRRSNLPAALLAVRERLCSDLGMAEEALPFAGELLQVREEERDWEGAIERLLHNFGQSLLVPDEHYAAVAGWVDRTHLRGRLVYYRVRAARSQALPDLRPDALARKLVIRPDSEHYPWLEQELARRFDHACCDDLEQFRRERQAITRAGQIKGGGERHEKDDRHRIDDRSRYILGWSNEAKIATLEQDSAALERQMQEGSAHIATLQGRQRGLDDYFNQLVRMQTFIDFRQLDWQALVIEIDRLEAERRALETESDTLRTLQRQLGELEEEIRQTAESLDAAKDDRTTARNKREAASEMLANDRSTLAATAAEVRERDFPHLDAMRDEALGSQRLTVESADNRQQDFRQWLQEKIDAEDKRLARLRERIVDAMRRYQNAWPQQTAEVDCSIEAIGDYRGMLDQLARDDLPRFEARFKQLLNENTIREVAGFQAQLNREREQIRERIELINRSLTSIDYNPNRYIKLLAEPSADVEVREFRQDLRACTEGVIGADDTYTEGKFLQVRNIIERLRGREGMSDLDRRWRRKVIDVRNWFVFSASERWREDDTEHEHYSDSGGKSGGQKEKLAYTVLAASLAYQFGLEQSDRRSRSFRFVVIDEAFGRGSDESARYGLELFDRLNLQLLIVTPLQKIHIIEPYVASVGFVHNDGRQSLMRNLTIEEYRAEQEARSLIRVEP
ncbi:MAG: ATP-dependent exonuclease SbcCD, C subunit-like protein [Gammaproteobacteria bacterium]|nr:ATP-dependent exonuclease SbcCD, C subunit-like protein [Gammaproteobacteria bacterium]